VGLFWVGPVLEALYDELSRDTAEELGRCLRAMMSAVTARHIHFRPVIVEYHWSSISIAAIPLKQKKRLSITDIHCQGDSMTALDRESQLYAGRSSFLQLNMLPISVITFQPLVSTPGLLNSPPAPGRPD
jgi:hypothetical protein